MSAPKKVRIGDLLVEAGVISPAQLDAGLAAQRDTGKKLGRVLIELGALSEDDLLKVLSKQLDLPFVGLRQFPFNIELVNRLDESYARRHKAIVLANKGGIYQVGMADPFGYFCLRRTLLAT